MMYALALAAALLASPAGSHPPPPNFIVIQAEAQGWPGTSVEMDGQQPHDARPAGLTPNLERLAAVGVRFSDFYVTCPRCTPSRASLVTGISPAKLHMTYQGEGAARGEQGGNRPERGGGEGRGKREGRADAPDDTVRLLRLIPPEPERDLPSGVRTIGAWLRTAGYASAHFGKWHVGRSAPSAVGFDVCDGANSNQGPERGVAPNPTQATAITDRGIAFMREQVEAGRPFYLQLDHYGFGNEREVTPEALQAARALAPDARAKELAAIAGARDVDTQVGRVLAAVQQLGIANNTFIIYTSDHGQQGGGQARPNDPLAGGKGSLSEGGVRVPLIVAGPGIAGGRVLQVRASNMDIVPTVLDYAGVAVPAPANRDAVASIEGASLAPVLQGRATDVPRQRDLVLHFPHYDLSNGGPATAIYRDQWKLVRHDDAGAVRLYDLRADRAESRDLSASQAALTRELTAAMDAYLDAVNAPRAQPNPDVERLKERAAPEATAPAPRTPTPSTPASAPPAPPPASPARTTAPAADHAKLAPFKPFEPHVHAFVNGEWIHVESDGLPHEPLAHPMMSGIVSWQQQVPLPQPYQGPNAWMVPLNPRLAAQPISGRTHLRRGAVAIAVNGVPIFNALNNRGEDAFKAGELDEFGGHSGRGDDYHYHIAPLALQKVVGPSSPIAYALDGFPLYGLFDPKATAGSDRSCPLGSTEPLDEFNGHFAPSAPGVGTSATRGYHYHASLEYPYINGGLRGAATMQDDQVVPQPRAQSARPAQSPLPGAKVLGVQTVGPFSWALRYTVNGQERTLRYARQPDGSYRFTTVDAKGAPVAESPSSPPEGDRPRQQGKGARKEGGGRQQQQGRGEDRDAPQGPRGEGGGPPQGPRGEGGGPPQQRDSLLARMTAFHTDTPPSTEDIVLVRPTRDSMGVSVRSATPRWAMVEYGPADASSSAPAKSAGLQRTQRQELAAGTAALFTLGGLQPATRYSYRVVWSDAAGKAAGSTEPRTFTTPRPAGQSFQFAIQADSHLDQGVDLDVYRRTLEAIRESKADFLVDLGDTFMTDKRREDFRDAAPQYDAQRHWLGIPCSSMPLFMVLGNHDGERRGQGARGDEMADWSFDMRTARFPAPMIAPGGMYTGRTGRVDGKGANYYAFEWGDALFVVLDPFSQGTDRARSSKGDGNSVPIALDDSSWSTTLGREQYDWLASTLAASKARHRFVFTHHLVGGRGGNEARGGVGSAPYFEWGGRNADGTDGFAEHRPGWSKPIHELLRQHHVTAVFHGHDHIYAHGVLDGIHYQCVPQPGTAGSGASSVGPYGYTQSVTHPGAGFLRVTVEPGEVKVDYLGTSAPKSKGGLVESYTVPASSPTLPASSAR